MREHTTIRLPYKTSEDRGDSPPLHPGEVLREDFMPHFGVGTAELSAALGLSTAHVEDFLAERRNVTTELARRLGHVFGMEARYWLALQKQFDLWHGRMALERNLKPNLRHRHSGVF